MSKLLETDERVMVGTNVARLYRLPRCAAADKTGWSRRHLSALISPQDLFEHAMVNMLFGWLLYADIHRRTYMSVIGDDGVLGPEWAAIGNALRGLLNGELKRLDGGTLDGLVLDTLEANGIDTGDL